MEATMFTAGLRSPQAHAAALKVAHPLMLRAIAAARKRRSHRRWQDLRLLALRFSAGKLLASTAIRERRRTLPIATCWCARWCR